MDPELRLELQLRLHEVARENRELGQLVDRLEKLHRPVSDPAGEGWRCSHCVGNNGHHRRWPCWTMEIVKSCLEL